jgi:hypothetical protein
VRVFKGRKEKKEEKRGRSEEEVSIGDVLR